MKSNTIEKTNKRDNSMPLLFHWMAEFKNRKQIYQFDGEGKEHLYQEVLDNFNSLKYFYLYHTKYNVKFKVDIEKGLIFINSKKTVYDWDNKKDNIRLIYFRRIRKHISSTTNKIIKTEIYYFLGLQWLKDGNNHKVLLQIDSCGNLIIGN